MVVAAIKLIDLVVLVPIHEVRTDAFLVISVPLVHDASALVVVQPIHPGIHQHVLVSDAGLELPILFAPPHKGTHWQVLSQRR